MPGFRPVTSIRWCTVGCRSAGVSVPYVGSAEPYSTRTNDPLRVVAQQWGFTDIRHLDRCFRRHYGCSPATYRRQHILKRPRVPASDDPVQRAREPLRGVTAAVDG